MSNITLAEQRYILELCNRRPVIQVLNTVETIAINRGVPHSAPVSALLTAVKNILLNQIDRNEHRYLEEEDNAGEPTHEFALLFVAYAEAGGTLRQDSDTEDWPAWTQDLLEDCKESLKEKGE